MVSIVEAAKEHIIERLEETKLRIRNGAEIDREFDLTMKMVEDIMSDLDSDIRLIIDTYW